MVLFPSQIRYYVYPQLSEMGATKLLSWKLGSENSLNHQYLSLALPDYIEI